MPELTYAFQILTATDLMVLQDDMNDLGICGYTAVGGVTYSFFDPNSPSGFTYVQVMKLIIKNF
jgi:hypothetical protein